MLGAIGNRGPDVARVWTSGAVGLGHCLLAATPESVGEVQPHAAAESGLSIVFDGRLDNRQQLAEEFERARLPISAAFDAAYALAAYRCWGSDCAARLLGDFAFAVWDAGQRRLFCARDIMAQKPFYYHHGRDLFLFASEPQALLKHPAVSRRPNEGMVGECLSVITSDADTLLADVQRLPRAHRIVVSSGGFRLDRYWDVDTGRTIRYPSVDEYCEHLRGLLRQAVGDRLRSSTNTGVMLSGGVDSSSIMATATQLIRSGSVTGGCDAFSLVDSGGLIDEKPFIDRTVAMLGCSAHQYTPLVIPVGAYHDVTRRRADMASSPGARLMSSVRAGAQRHGVRVLLSGAGGDEWFGGSFYHCADLFRSGQWIALASYIRSLASFPEFELPRPALKVMIWPLLPRAVRKRIKVWSGRDGVPRWICRDFAKRIALADRLYPLTREPPFPTIAQRSIYQDMTGGAVIHFIEDEERSGAEFGIEMRYPYADRRIVEFGLAIPEELRWRGGQRKLVLREAMRDRLPVEVLARKTSPNAGSAFLPTLRALAHEGLLRHPAIEREGWVDAGHVRTFYERILSRQRIGDPDYTDDVWPMWIVATVELWMREVADRSSSVEGEPICEMTTALTSGTQASGTPASASLTTRPGSGSTAASPS